MTRILRVLLCFACASPIAAAAQTPPATAPSAPSAPAPAPSRALRQGDIEVTSRANRHTPIEGGRATAIVDAPAEIVMAIVSDYARYAEFLPKFEQSRVLSRRGNNALVYLQAKAAHDTMTVWAQLRIFERRPQGETRILEGHLTQGNVSRLDARWEVTPIDGGMRSLVSFEFLIDPDLPFPDSVVNDENRRVSRRCMEALRRRAAEPRFGVARLDR